jgi:tetratricopeptide (TPR) repeat protein
MSDNGKIFKIALLYTLTYLMLGCSATPQNPSIQHNSTNTSILLQKYSVAQNYDNQGQHEKAISLYKEILQTNPKEKQYLYNDLGLSFFRLNRLHEAISSYNEAIRIKWWIPEAHFGLGLAYEKLGESQKATTSFTEALAIFKKITSSSGSYSFSNPSWQTNKSYRVGAGRADALYNIGLIYGKLGRYQDSIAPLKKSIRKWPDYAQAHCILGIAYQQLGKIQKATTEYKEALRLDSTLTCP